MKTLLVSINAKYIHTNNAVRLLKANSDFEVDIYEYTIKDDILKIIKDIKQYNPDVGGLSIYIWNIEIFRQILNKLSLPNSKIIIGGPEVTYESSDFLNEYPVDFIIKGEGELVFDSLLKAINTNQDHSLISNLIYLKDNKITHTPLLEISNLDNLKLPYFFDFDIPHIPNKISYIETSRGCPYKCSYCLSSLDKKVRFFDMDKVKDVISYLMEHGSKTIKFLDRTFNANKKTLELFKYIIENDNHKTVFQFEITGDVLDPKIIEYLNQNAPKGLFRFEIGIQSTNQETNILVDRFQNTKKLFENIALIQKGSIVDLHLDLIAGLPKEDLISFKKTFDDVYTLGAKELQLGFLKMLKGTKIRREAKRYNYIYREKAPYEIQSNDSLSVDDIKEIHLVEHMLDIHHNKEYFGINLHNYILNTNSPYLFFKEIGEFYLVNNYSFKGYQIEDVYSRIFKFIKNKEIIFTIKKDYLNRSKIKPKIFWEEGISKQEKNVILKKTAIRNQISINSLYKHSILIKYQNEYLVVLYKDFKSIAYSMKEDIG
ncbi:MAG: DUF4080 domain-containing protein [Candidatus Izimaplasma sp.]|nr:DUF4080 domain-containing protein [Candidatus Izimaplasma bacterium]